MRRPVEFVVVDAGEGDQETVETRYLRADGTWEKGKEQAAVFRLFPTATQAEKIRIDMRLHEYAGGLTEYLELEEGLLGARLRCRAIVEMGVWPKGRPETEDATERLAQEKLFETAWKGWHAPVKDAYRTMQNIMDRLLFMAMWRVLVVAVPEGWDSLADRTNLDDATFAALQRAWTKSLEATREGK